MAVPSGVICFWPATVGSIPAGWTRDDRFNSLYIRGAPDGGDADFTGYGATSHTHVVAGPHTPTQEPHYHLISAAAATEGGIQGGAVVVKRTHEHAFIASGTATATNQAYTPTVDAGTNELSYTTAVFIISDGSPAGIPNLAHAMFLSDTFPASWTRVLGNKYVKGAAAGLGAPTSGGFNNHSHNIEPHTHIQDPHSHGAVDSEVAGVSTASVDGTFPGAYAAHSVHTHSVSLDSQTATNMEVVNVTNSAFSDPPHLKINIIRNGTGADSLPADIICLWGGTHGTIPAGWSRFIQADGYFVRGAASNGVSGTYGGTSTHIHEAECIPDQDPHDHSVSAGLGSASVEITELVNPAGAQRFVADSHVHVWTATAEQAYNEAVVYQLNANTAESSFPPYVRPIFIRFREYESPGAHYAPRKNRRKPLRVRVRTSFEPEAPYDIDGGPSGEWADPGFSSRRKAKRAQATRYLRRALNFEADAPFDIDGGPDGVWPDMSFAARRKAQRVGNLRRALRRAWSEEPDAPFDVDGGPDHVFPDMVFAIRRRSLRTAAARYLRRTWSEEPDAPFDIDGGPDGVVPDLGFSSRRRTLRGARFARMLQRAVSDDPDAPFDEDGESDGGAWPDPGFSARRRALRGLIASRALRRTYGEEPDAPFDEDGNSDPVFGELVFAVRRRVLRARLAQVRRFDPYEDTPIEDGDPPFDPVWGELVHAARRLMFRGARRRNFYRGQLFEEEAPPPPPEQVFKRSPSMYQKFEMFHRTGRKIGGSRRR